MSSAPTPALPPIDNETPALRKAWHAVATVEEVGDGPFQAWLLGEPWALVRLDGELRAFVDRCPHRLAPLTVGRLCEGSSSAATTAGPSPPTATAPRCRRSGQPTTSRSAPT